MTEQDNPAESSTAATVPTQDDNKIIAECREKLVKIHQQGVAFPDDFRLTHRAGDLQAKHRELEQVALEAEPVQVAIAGRMILKRVMGKASFAAVQDSTDRIQFYTSRDAVGEDVYTSFKEWDLGNIVAAHGALMKTKIGELSVAVMELRLPSRSLRPLPDDYYGLTDREQKYRQHYVDLIVSKETRDTFRARIKAMASLHNFMTGNGFMGVKTPILHPTPGGTVAKPFVTHHNALDMQMFLRIAPELYLRRLIVGGFGRVYEVNRNFRNEGVSPRHSPEFTMMEFYAAYMDYRWLMGFAEQLIRQATIDASGTATLTCQGRELGLIKPFHRLTVCQATQEYAPQYTDAQLTDVDFLRAELKKLKIDTNAPQFLNVDVGTLQPMLFEETAELQLWGPTFIIDYPVEVLPLARSFDTLPGVTERFELFITGREIANGFPGLNNPEGQAKRSRKQVERKDASNEEAMSCNADYIHVLECGMSPTGGCGVDTDRLVILLTDSPNIRDVVLFPHLRRED